MISNYQVKNENKTMMDEQRNAGETAISNSSTAMDKKHKIDKFTRHKGQKGH